MWALDSDGPSEHEDERCENLRQALARLTEADLALLALKYEECFDTERIAEAMSIPEGTVRSRLFYLRDKIRKVMKENKS